MARVENRILAAAAISKVVVKKEAVAEEARVAVNQAAVKLAGRVVRTTD